MASNDQELNFPIAFYEDISIIKLPERLTVLEAIAFKHTCHEVLDRYSIEQLTLDFGNTKFIDSSGIGALVNNFKAAENQKVKLVLTNVNPPVMAVLSMTGLDNILAIESGNCEQSSPSNFNYEPELPTTHPSVRSPVKRIIDIIGAIVGLSITSFLFVPIAIAIKLDSPGPIFFAQTRCGWLGKKFTMWKFRSMCNNAEFLKKEIPNQASGAFFKNEKDPRITKVGKFLRRTSLDELPQFLNVLKGDMSLVGTRPPTPGEVELYQVPQWQRLNVKPGMTGEWQVNGRSQVRNFEDVIALDLKYQRNWSLAYDLRLIIRTILILFHKDSGAV
ncbi:MAG: STAS domain-containing protein [Cyanobacteria bacterium J083]|nr:MAG: STAS domain-containing protein [Cyanobacteria bacterium J083]